MNKKPTPAPKPEPKSPGALLSGRQNGAHSSEQRMGKLVRAKEPTALDNWCLGTTGEKP